MNPQLQSPLFRLPLEIRYNIYAFFLHGLELPLPESPDVAECIPRCDRITEAPGPLLCYPSVYQNPLIGLALICRIMLIEIDQLKQRLPKSREPPRCKLDLIVNRDLAIPTWIVRPHQGAGTEYDLEVSLRFFDLIPIPVFLDDVWINTIRAPLFAILNGLLHHGPQFLPSEQVPLPAPRPMKFNNITFAFTYPSSHSVGPCETFFGPRFEIVKAPEGALEVVFEFFESLEWSGVFWGKVRELRMFSNEMGMGRRVKVTHSEASPQ